MSIMIYIICPDKEVTVILLSSYGFINMQDTICHKNNLVVYKESTMTDSQ